MYEERLRELGLFRVESAILRGGLINAYKYCRGGCRALQVPSDRDSGRKLKRRRFHFNRKKNFTLRVSEHWNRLPREVVAFPSLETFQTHVDTFPWKLLQLGRAG